ncbi:extracellular solute-binding protein [Streptomyces sp. NPDC048266]|uniref:extracellular solute-binding protein n=1 Tax=Streptomyces sp. NPDC048266 TaxID=3155787 RepID=UPI0033CB2D7B
MARTFTATLQPLDTIIPNPALVVLIGAAGSGESTCASTCPSTQVLEFDRFRAMVSDEAVERQAAADAVAALRTVLETRLTRKRTTVVDATNCERAVRSGLVQAARRHGVPRVAVLMGTPVSLCVIRQTARTRDRAVPADTPRARHTAAVAAFPGLRVEGFDYVVFADHLHRLGRRCSGPATDAAATSAGTATPASAPFSSSAASSATRSCRCGAGWTAPRSPCARTSMSTATTPSTCWRGCGAGLIPVQGGAAGLAAHHRTVHDSHRDYGDHPGPSRSGSTGGAVYVRRNQFRHIGKHHSETSPLEIRPQKSPGRRISLPGRREFPAHCPEEQEERSVRPRLSGVTAAMASFGLVGSLVTGCGDSHERATLRLVVPEYGDTPTTSSKAYWDRLTTAFTAAHPGTTVEVTIHPWADVDREVTRMVQEDHAPDVALMGAYSDFAAQGRLYAASEVMSIRTESNFLPALADAGSVDGTLHGFPFVASSRLLFYNKELFENAGAKPPKTWSDLKDAAMALKEEGVLYPYALPLGPEEAHAEALIWELSNGGGYTDAQGNYSFTSEQNIQTFRWIQDNLVAPKLTGPVPPAQLNRKDAFAAFLRGDVGMVNGYPSLLHEAREKGMKVATSRMPVSDTLGSEVAPPAVGVADWMVAFKRGDNRELVSRFLNFVYQDKNLTDFAARYHLLPSTVTATEASQDSAADAGAEQFLSALRGARLYPVDDPSWLQVSDIVKRNIGNAVAPSAEPKVVLQNIAEQAREAQRRG